MAEAGYTVLVVDDDRDVREMAVAVLEAQGYHVLAAASGDEAHRLLLANPTLPLDILFTDVAMPGRFDGIDLADAARSLRPGLPVLLTTGFADLARGGRDLNLPGPILPKPYRPGELRNALAALLQRVA